MVCNVIEECRCYAYSDVRDPKETQFCGVRKGPNVDPCPADCCHGGCPGDFPKEPFRIIDRPRLDIKTVVHDFVKYLDSRTIILILLIFVQLLVIIL